MKINPKEKYVRKIQKDVGRVNFGGIRKAVNPERLANRVLAFMITGLSTY